MLGRFAVNSAERLSISSCEREVNSEEVAVSLAKAGSRSHKADRS